MNSVPTPAAPKPPVTLWHDARFVDPPPPYRAVTALIQETKMAVTAYRTPAGEWRQVGQANKPITVTWWADCIPVPLPDRAREADRLAHEARGQITPKKA